MVDRPKTKVAYGADLDWSGNGLSKTIHDRPAPQGSSSPAQHVPSYGTHPPGVCCHYGTDLSNRPVITGQTL